MSNSVSFFSYHYKYHASTIYLSNNLQAVMGLTKYPVDNSKSKGPESK